MSKEIREIKYRVWNDRYKEFTYWGFIDNTFKGPPTGSGLSIEECKNLSQQFTGKKCFNGKEVYEGDILYSRYEDQQEEKGYCEVWNEVVFQNGAFGWIGETTGQFHSFHDEPINETSEAVGNIYQNSELLDSDSKQ